MSPHDAYRLRLLVIVIALLGLVVTVSISVLIGQYAPAAAVQSEIAAEITDRDILEGNTELKIPTNATDIHGYVDGFRDVTTLLRFTMPAYDLDSFLKQTSCALPLKTDSSRSVWSQNSPIHKWWRPGDAQRFAVCIGSTPQLGRRLFFDMTQPDQYIVYVVASTR